MSALNVGEVYYFLRKNHSEQLAESWRESSRTLPVTIEEPTEDEIWDAALLQGRSDSVRGCLRRGAVAEIRVSSGNG
jgi:hypothetical protein